MPTIQQLINQLKKVADEIREKLSDYEKLQEDSKLLKKIEWMLPDRDIDPSQPTETIESRPRVKKTKTAPTTDEKTGTTEEISDDTIPSEVQD